MKRILFAAAAFSIIAASSWAIEIGFEPETGNIFFPWSQSTGQSEAFPQTNFFWGGSAYYTQRITDELSFKTIWGLDSIMRSSLSAVISYDAGFARLGFGPFLGAFNSATQIVKSGLSTDIQLEWPGVAFVLLRSDSSLGGILSAVGDYFQEATRIGAGFYIPNAIVTLSMETKKMTLCVSTDFLTTDSVLRYVLSLDIYKKNVPYNVLWTIGYQETSKTYSNSGTETKDSIGSLVLGVRFDMQITPAFELKLGINASMYSFGLADMAAYSPSPDSFLFSATLGAVIRIDEDPAPASIFSLTPREEPPKPAEVESEPAPPSP